MVKHLVKTFGIHSWNIRARQQLVLNGNGYCQTITTRSQATSNTCRPRRQCSTVRLVVVVLLRVVTILSLKFELSFLSFFLLLHLNCSFFVLFTNKLFLRRRSLRRCCSSYRAPSAGCPSILLQCSWLLLSDNKKIIYRQPPHVTTYLTNRKLFSTILPIL